MIYKSILLSLSTLLLHTTIFSQCTFPSTNGYSVNVSIAPVNVIYHTNGGGCTYETVMQYNIQFTGSNIPTSMYTLQGVVHCYGSSQSFDLPNGGGSGTVTSATTSGGFIAGACSQYKPSGCTSVNIIIEGPGIPPQNVPCAFVTFPTPLPIELTGFTAEQTTTGAQLNWTTASERNNDHFTIERSTNGIDFTDIAVINGAGTTNEENNYSFLDKDFNTGLMYYRLTQTDYDGKFQHLDIISLKNKMSDSYIVFPNPTMDRTINIQTKSKNTAVNFTVFSMFGQVESTGTLPFDQSVSTINLPQEGSTFYLELMQEGSVIGRQLIYAN